MLSVKDEFKVEFDWGQYIKRGIYPLFKLNLNLVVSISIGRHVSAWLYPYL